MEAGNQIGKCQILEKLGTGTHGTVYKAKHSLLHKIVAIKLLNIITNDEQKIWNDIINNVREAAQLEHPNIVSIYDIGEENNQYYITTQFIDGNNLLESIQKKGCLNFEWVLTIAQETARALQLAHSKGILHRNIKPSNILISSNQEIKLCDFGTINYQSSGASLYISPEEAKKEKLDPRSDLYSLGCVLYHALIGEPPYWDSDSIIVMQQHISGQIPLVCEKNPDIPEEIGRLVTRLLAKDPNERFESALEFLNRLEESKGEHIKRRSRTNVHTESETGVISYKIGQITNTNRRIRKETSTENSRKVLPKMPGMAKDLRNNDEPPALLEEDILPLPAQDMNAGISSTSRNISKKFSISKDSSRLGLDSSTKVLSHTLTKTTNISNITISRETTKDSSFPDIVETSKITNAISSDSKTEKIENSSENDSEKTKFSPDIEEKNKSSETPKTSEPFKSPAPKSGIFPPFKSELPKTNISGVSTPIPSISKTTSIQTPHHLPNKLSPNSSTTPLPSTKISSPPKESKLKTNETSSKPTTSGFQKLPTTLSPNPPPSPGVSIFRSPKIVSANELQNILSTPSKPPNIEESIEDSKTSSNTTDNKLFPSKILEENESELNLPSTNQDPNSKRLFSRPLVESAEVNAPKIDMPITPLMSIGKTSSESSAANFGKTQLSKGSSQKPEIIPSQKPESPSFQKPSPPPIIEESPKLIITNKLLAADSDLSNISKTSEGSSLPLSTRLANAKIGMAAKEPLPPRSSIPKKIEKKDNKITTESHSALWVVLTIFIILVAILTALVIFPKKSTIDITQHLQPFFEKNDFEGAKKYIEEFKEPISIFDRREWLEQVKNSEQNYHKKVLQDNGWFNEPMPSGMKRHAKTGDYLWQKDNSLMVFVPEGEFMRGSDKRKNDERPMKKVNVESFYIDKYELSSLQYEVFEKQTGKFEWQGDSMTMSPIVRISWEEARMYASWAEKRLPTEMEWEKAARGGLLIPDWETTTLPIPMKKNPIPTRTYPWGEDAPDTLGKMLCNYKQAGKPGTLSYSGKFKTDQSPYHCYDMAGNVLEWCQDIYQERYNTQQPKSITSSMERSVRGGSFETSFDNLRCTRRWHFVPKLQYPDLGVRLAK